MLVLFSFRNVAVLKKTTKLVFNSRICRFFVADGTGIIV